MYLNIDAGTMNPIEHGEVFVTHDGLETDQDLGHYERFLGETLTRANYMTNGQLYSDVLKRERALEYNGVCVQPYHHIPPEIIKRWYEAGKENNSEVVIVELGGTVGEYEGLLFLEAVRRLKLKKPGDIILIHVGYLPVPSSIGELKSKPLQQSVGQLNSVGLQPDIVIGRAHKMIDEKRQEKIALASGLAKEDIISNPDLDCTYDVPKVLNDQGLATKISKKLSLKQGRKDLTQWMSMAKRLSKASQKVKIAMIGKYQKTGDYTLEDSYVCVVEALKHAGGVCGVSPELIWIDSQDFEKVTKDKISDRLGDIQAMIVPQGWGKRGTEGKIKAIQYARENKIPYLGLCFGMQMATIEFARNVLNLEKANSQEIDDSSPNQVIHVMPDQKDYLAKKQYGGTIRLGAWPCVVKKGTKLEKAYLNYGKSKSSPWFEPNLNDKKKYSTKTKLIVQERHRHRYEFNTKYKEKFLKKGFVISGTSPDGKLVEAVELADHPFFVGTQFHPEYISRPLTPHPIFVAFMDAAKRHFHS